jgi:hypothetical protein
LGTLGPTAQLTNWEQDNVDAAVLWCLAIRHAIRTGKFDLRAGLGFVPDGARRDRWSDVIDGATAAGVHPRDFRENNGRVVVAFLGAASSAVRVTRPHPDGLETRRHPPLDDKVPTKRCRWTAVTAIMGA